MRRYQSTIITGIIGAVVLSANAPGMAQSAVPTNRMAVTTPMTKQEQAEFEREFTVFADYMVPNLSAINSIMRKVNEQKRKLTKTEYDQLMTAGDGLRTRSSAMMRKWKGKAEFSYIEMIMKAYALGLDAQEFAKVNYR